mmetsp:Transcript_6375/g.22594  ORF Transcript_6375/g.22594 Transcript_6375/m.22594 type:complete len:252 (-) Transcript_6375:324-1079(-)
MTASNATRGRAKKCSRAHKSAQPTPMARTANDVFGSSHLRSSSKVREASMTHETNANARLKSSNVASGLKTSSRGGRSRSARWPSPRNVSHLRSRRASQSAKIRFEDWPPSAPSTKAVLGRPAGLSLGAASADGGASSSSSSETVPCIVYHAAPSAARSPVSRSRAWKASWEKQPSSAVPSRPPAAAWRSCGGRASGPRTRAFSCRKAAWALRTSRSASLWASSKIEMTRVARSRPALFTSMRTAYRVDVA